MIDSKSEEELKKYLKEPEEKPEEKKVETIEYVNKIIKEIKEREEAYKSIKNKEYYKKNYDIYKIIEDYKIDTPEKILYNCTINPKNSKGFKEKLYSLG